MSSKFGAIVGVVGAAIAATLLVPYEKEETEDGYKLKAVAYTVEQKKADDGKQMKVTVAPLINQQIDFVKKTVTGLFDVVGEKVKGTDAAEDFDDVSEDLLGDIEEEPEENSESL